ncbi:MAG: carboxy-S-adenosyl-L-methionine synthase CmoA [Planctomycetaceae bacterium]|nr:carboxy-S-adenosyl-L-methionine synthase CmoA [Planctomycetaceae bacterium]
MSTDRIYSAPLSSVGDFEFDETVADVFPDMIQRSVPGYASMLSMIAQCARLYARPATNVYDLGCSLGAATFAIRREAPADCVIHAVDNSAAMVQRLQQTVQETSSDGCAINVQQNDIRDTVVQNASLVVLNLTLQFVPPDQRDRVIGRIAQGMNSGGALVLSEKIRFEDDGCQNLMTEFHHEFKRTHGYSDLEIAQKRTAIENRLKPETIQQHVRRLQDAGFSTICPWFQCFNFASILAIRH